MSAHRPPRGVGVLCLAQAAVFGALAWHSRLAWPPMTGLAVAGGLGMIGAAAGILLRRSGRAAFLGGLVALLAAAVATGLYLHAAWHLVARFGPDAARAGRVALGSVFLAIPWVAGLPAWLVARFRPTSWGRAAGGAAILAVALPPLAGRAAHGPVARWPAQADLPAAAEAAFARWQGGEAALPVGEGPATVLLTAWGDGRARATARGDGDTLGEAVAEALAGLPPPEGARPALVLDAARVAWDEGPAPPGRGGWLTEKGGAGPTTAWRPDAVVGRAPLPGWPIPDLAAPEGAWWAAFDGAVADASGARLLDHGWTAPPALDAREAREAAVRGGRMLARNQGDDGRFAYLLLGPDAEPAGSYNLPRHAGTSWFLGRTAAATGDAVAARAADAGIAWMLRHTTRLDDGRAFVADPKRKDGKVWVGTTALALLAALSRDHPAAGPWARFVASSVDEAGRVRGEARLDDGAFPAQRENPYGQGQVLLALAAAVRAGLDEARPALVRLARRADEGYAPLGADKLLTLDEHWACLAALATRDALGRAAGWPVCRAYLAHELPDAPRGGDLWPSAGPGGGAAEALVAGAVLDPTGPWRDAALAWARLFLASAYRPGDRPFLIRPDRYLGGFRDVPWRYDVRIDAVQHIGCALLGAEALLGGEPRPGSLP